jgi:hypothetical protein
MKNGMTVPGLPQELEAGAVRRRAKRLPAKDRGVYWINVYADPAGGYVYGMEWGSRGAADWVQWNGQRALYRLKVRPKPMD